MPHSYLSIKIKKGYLELNFSKIPVDYSYSKPLSVYLIHRKSSTIMGDSSAVLLFNFQYKVHILEFFFS